MVMLPGGHTLINRKHLVHLTWSFLREVLVTKSAKFKRKIAACENLHRYSDTSVFRLCMYFT